MRSTSRIWVYCTIYLETNTLFSFTFLALGIFCAASAFWTFFRSIKLGKLFHNFSLIHKFRSINSLLNHRQITIFLLVEIRTLEAFLLAGQIPSKISSQNPLWSSYQPLSTTGYFQSGMIWSRTAWCTGYDQRLNSWLFTKWLCVLFIASRLTRYDQGTKITVSLISWTTLSQARNGLHY
jgi:hypothetical protein